VHVEEMVGYVETGDFSTELHRLTNKYDGHLDQVHPMRDAYGADDVSLIVDSNQWCGLAWILNNGPNIHGFEVLAFNVVSRICLGGNPTLAHELGHNMGSEHDLANSTATPSHPYSYGWVTANGTWRTIMAIVPVAQLHYFSNPNKSFAGQALGATGQAENWLSLNQNAAAVAQWRCAIPAPYGAPKPSSGGKLPRMAWTGQPVFDGSGGFELRIVNGEPNKPAICFYGQASANLPFGGGTLWVAPPIVRLPPRVLDGNGNARFPFPHITQFAPGVELYAQGWFRDPAHPDGSGVGLTDGLRVDVCEFKN